MQLSSSCTLPMRESSCQSAADNSAVPPAAAGRSGAGAEAAAAAYCVAAYCAGPTAKREGAPQPPQRHRLAREAAALRLHTAALQQAQVTCALLRKTHHRQFASSTVFHVVAIPERTGGMSALQRFLRPAAAQWSAIFPEHISCSRLHQTSPATAAGRTRHRRHAPGAAAGNAALAAPARSVPAGRSATNVRTRSGKAPRVCGDRGGRKMQEGAPRRLQQHDVFRETGQEPGEKRLRYELG